MIRKEIDMRKIIALALCLIMLLSIVACKDNADENTETDTNTSAVTTTEDTADTSDADPEKQVGTGEWTKLY